VVACLHLRELHVQRYNCFKRLAATLTMAQEPKITCNAAPEQSLHHDLYSWFCLGARRCSPCTTINDHQNMSHSFSPSVTLCSLTHLSCEINLLARLLTACPLCCELRLKGSGVHLANGIRVMPGPGHTMVGLGSYHDWMTTREGAMGRAANCVQVDTAALRAACRHVIEDPPSELSRMPLT
jgi:hypothetical protein